ncbi:hypothetical protein NBE98_08600 [Clostridium swellfunianum]|uniref:hypothetical protein n=1 Tax=Clostridium swellfunianum TaxID=1367462 RepID=UPI00202F804D|nr:hypothetical protein [Clostridium swellfunianum]MCM0648432.1 hypothetical protein [Clostridium swellfunianum]
MKELIKIIEKRIGVYIRKKKTGENLSTGYGRLQWLSFELSDHTSEIEEYIDEFGEDFEIHELFEDIKSGYIEAVLLWSIKDAEIFNINTLVNLCHDNEIPIVSFCEVIECIQ